MGYISNKHEEKKYKQDPNRVNATGKIEEFRAFIIGLLKKQNKRFHYLHDAVSPNSVVVIREYIKRSNDKEITKWLKLYQR